MQAAPGVPAWTDQPGLVFVLSVAISATSYVALTCHQRPIAQAYELGYEMGRRDAIRDANRRDLSPIRRTPQGLGQSSRTGQRRPARLSMDV